MLNLCKCKLLFFNFLMHSSAPGGYFPNVSTGVGHTHPFPWSLRYISAIFEPTVGFVWTLLKVSNIPETQRESISQCGQTQPDGDK